jgi:hypothetical protein
VKLADIMAATGLSKTSASMVRAGRTVPHVRHWPALRSLEPSRERRDASGDGGVRRHDGLMA